MDGTNIWTGLYMHVNHTFVCKDMLYVCFIGERLFAFKFGQSRAAQTV